MAPLHNPHLTGFNTPILVPDRRSQPRTLKFDHFTLDFQGVVRDPGERPAKRFSNPRKATRLAQEIADSAGQAIEVVGWIGVKRVLIVVVKPREEG